MDCKKSTSGLLKVGNADYIIVNEFKDSVDIISELKRRKYIELLESYKIKEGTCIAALLKQIASFISPEGCEDEYIFYLSLLNNERLRDGQEVL